LFSCEKDEPKLYAYQIINVQRPNSLDCKYTAKCEGRPIMEFFAACGKYKMGDKFYATL